MDWFHSFTISFLYLSFFLYQGLGAMALYLTSYTRRDKGVLVVPFGPLCNWKDFLGPINVFVLGGGGNQMISWMCILRTSSCRSEFVKMCGLSSLESYYRFKENSPRRVLYVNT